MKLPNTLLLKDRLDKIMSTIKKTTELLNIQS